METKNNEKEKNVQKTEETEEVPKSVHNYAHTRTQLCAIARRAVRSAHCRPKQGDAMGRIDLFQSRRSAMEV